MLTAINIQIFNRVFAPDAEQSVLFEHSTLPLLRRFEDGESCVLFAYGITNAGKTHTIQGTAQEPGILPRIVAELFDSSLTDRIALHLSMMEIYQEQIFDLLSKKREKLSIRDGHGKLDVPRLSHHKLASAADAVRLMNQGSAKRCMSKTKLNAESSRSHAMYSITMTKTVDDRETISVFHIVDLAGAERVNRTKATGFQMKEANNINMSLMNLWRCLNAMKKKSGESVDIIPFRESKLTHLLMPLLSRASVGGVVMIACVNPQPDDYDETLSVLSNASLASKIKEIANMGRVATNSTAVSSTLYQPTASSMNKEDKIGMGQKFLRKRKVGEVDGPQQSLMGKLSSHMGWSKKEKAATVNLTAVLSASKLNRSSSVSVSEQHRSSTATIESSTGEDLLELLHQMNELRKENAELIQAHANRETEIRQEVAEEMAQSMALLLEQIQDLQEQLYQESAPVDLTRSVKKARRKMIQASKDTTTSDLVALEEEMEAVRHKYEHEIAELKDKLHLYEGMMKDYQQQAKEHARVAVDAMQLQHSSPVRSPLMVLKNSSNASNKSSPGNSSHPQYPVVSKRTSNIELSLDIQNDVNPLPQKRSPSPLNDENRGPPSVFPTGVTSPKFNSSAFRMLRSQVTAGK